MDVLPRSVTEVKRKYAGPTMFLRLCSVTFSTRTTPQSSTTVCRLPLDVCRTKGRSRKLSGLSKASGGGAWGGVGGWEGGGEEAPPWTWLVFYPLLYECLVWFDVDM